MWARRAMVVERQGGMRQAARAFGAWGLPSTSKEGARMVFVIRHAERLDRTSKDGWSGKALRPQDTPLSQRGVRQAKRLGKWLYGRLPIERPLAIFCSPFVRCVQTADAIAEQLEGLQKEGLHVASATRIMIEPGLCEDMVFMRGMRQHEPFFLQAADLMSISQRVDLNYTPIRDVKLERGPVYPGPCVEVGCPDRRLATIGLELAENPLVRGGGTALMVTHGKPSAEIVRSLCPNPGGVHIPCYDDIKDGKYDGPPLQYTATTALERDATTNTWYLAKGFDLFSNAHDPRLSSLRLGEQARATRYVLGEKLQSISNVDEANALFASSIGERDLEIAAKDLCGSKPNQRIVAKAPLIGPVALTLPKEYRPGDVIRCRVLGRLATDPHPSLADLKLDKVDKTVLETARPLAKAKT